MATIVLEVDASDLKNKVNMLKFAMKPEQFTNAMYGIFNRTQGHVRKILQQDLPQEYYVKAGQIKSAVNGAKVINSGGMIGCAIPIRDSRGSIGGRYSASGGAHGWASVHRKYRVRGKIVKSGQTTLPRNMKNYGGQPPFRNLSAKKLNGVTFTRAGKDRLPIRKVVGIAIPQMPMTRSQDDVQRDIRKYLENELDRRFMALMRNGR